MTASFEIPVSVDYVGKGARILDFDCEARPLSWLGGDFVTKEVTAIAWKFIGEKGPVECRLLGEVTSEDMLQDFLDAYDEADIVTGHFIRGYDLPTINGALTEFGLRPLEDKLSQDTKLDLIRRQGISNSQESLAAVLGVKAPKVQMDQAKWRAANRLTLAGLDLTEKRVVGDVKQHIQMRAEMLRRGWLGPPKLWSAKGSRGKRYAP